MPDQRKNIRSLPQNIQTNQELIAEAMELGCRRAKVVSTNSIALGSWVHLQCQFGCSHYGKLLTCPPCSPTSSETSEILMEYKKALLIQGKDPKDMQSITSGLEAIFKKKGFHKAFAFSAAPCDLCSPCTVETECQHPEKARPTLQACGIDVHSTLSNNGWGDSSTAMAAPCSPSNDITMVLID